MDWINANHGIVGRSYKQVEIYLFYSFGVLKRRLLFVCLNGCEYLGFFIHVPLTFPALVLSLLLGYDAAMGTIRY